MLPTESGCVMERPNIVFILADDLGWNEPFLAYLSFYSVHSPLETTRERWAKFRGKACRTTVSRWIVA